MSQMSINPEMMIKDAQQIITDPASFYKSMPQSGGFPAPLIFAVIMSIVTAALLFILAIVNLGDARHMGVSAVGLLIGYPIAMVVGLFIGGAIMWVIWRLMGSSKDYEVAVRCMAFSTAILPVLAVASIIPLVGDLASALWGCYLLYIASITVHGIAAKTAQIVFGIFAVIGVLGALTA
ncbi:MAG: YIP1 family protein [Pseudomonadota bacterium]